VTGSMPLLSVTERECLPAVSTYRVQAVARSDSRLNKTGSWRSVKGGSAIPSRGICSFTNYHQNNRQSRCLLPKLLLRFDVRRSFYVILANPTDKILINTVYRAKKPHPGARPSRDHKYFISNNTLTTAIKLTGSLSSL